MSGFRALILSSAGALIAVQFVLYQIRMKVAVIGRRR